MVQFEINLLSHVASSIEGLLSLFELIIIYNNFLFFLLNVMKSILFLLN